MGKKRHNSTPEGSDDSALKFWPGTEDDFQVLQKELRQQSDRGVAILAGAQLEWRIRQIIETRLYRWDMIYPGRKTPEKIGAKVFGTDDSPGELGFLDQCRIAFCLGLVGETGFRDLERIAKIRNRFAHHLRVTRFDEDDKVSAICSQLETPEALKRMIAEAQTPTMKYRMGPCRTNRQKFITTSQVLYVSMYFTCTRYPIEWPQVKAGAPYFFL